METSVGLLASSSSSPKDKEGPLKSAKLSKLGELIFYDRYAKKDQNRDNLREGQRVVVCVDPASRQRELATVQQVQYETRMVEVQILVDQRVLTLPFDQIDLPVENLEGAFERMANAVAKAEAPDRRQIYRVAFHDILSDFSFVPAGRVWAGAGVEERLTPYNCLSGESIVHTRSGPFEIRRLAGKTVNILSHGGTYRPATFASYGTQPLFDVVLSNGDVLFATAGHEWVTVQSSRSAKVVTTLELEGRTIPWNLPQVARDEFFEDGVRHGLVFGDGTKTSTHKARLQLFGPKRELRRFFEDKTRFDVSERPECVWITGCAAAWKERPSVETASYMRGFILGLIATDGHVTKDGQVQISQSDKSLLDEIARVAVFAGFASNNVRVGRLVSNLGNYGPSYVLRLKKWTFEAADFLREDQRARWVAAKQRAVLGVEVLSVKPSARGEEEVFCCVEPETHTMTIGRGYLTKQCYVLPAPEDSRHGIIETLNRMTEIMSRGGGVGIPLMSLRPRYGIVRGVNGRSSGSVAWGELYSFGTGLIEQGGSRRGALMLIQYDWHPDIEEFINVKRDGKRINNANVSVGISDALMAAIEADADWDLVFPDTSHVAYNKEWDGDLSLWKSKGYPVQIYKTVKARDLWNSIIDSSWASAEPGVFFVDRYNQMSNSHYYSEGRIFCTNPCFSGDTRIATQHGMLPIKELTERGLPLKVTTDARVLPDYDIAPEGVVGTVVRDAVPAFKTSEAEEVFEIELDTGHSVKATAYHKFPTPEGFVELKDLEEGDELLLQSGEGQWGSEGNADLGLVMGWMQGDGWWSGKDEAVLRFYGNDKVQCQAEVLAAAQCLLPSGYTMEAYSVGKVDATEASSLALARVLAEYGFTAETKGAVPEMVWRGSRETVVGYLRGFFAADGQVNVSGHSLTCSVRLSQSNPTLLKEVQQLIQNFGITSRLYKRREAQFKRMPDGKGGSKDYWCQAQFDLCLAKINLARFVAAVGFVRGDHAAKYEAWMASRTREPYKEHFVAKVRSITSKGVEPVFCTTQPTHHTVVSAGISSGQCGEQGIPPWAVCNLGHVNLTKMIKGDGVFEPAQVDWDKLRWTVRTAVRFMDNVVDIAYAPFTNNDKQQKGERRVGLGTLGLGEMLIRCHVRYGDNQKCLAFLDELYGTICREAYLASSDIAAEKGSFPFFNAEKLLQSGFAKTLPEDVRGSIRTKGLRNVTLLTQAPTGTVGTMMNTSTGIEPFPWWEWERKGRLGSHREAAIVYQEYLAAHPDIQTKRSTLSVSDQFKTSAFLPEWFTATADMVPDDHSKTQAAIQRWVDSSISKTSNVPADFTRDQVGDFYRQLYKLGCKGGTVYRDQSRSEQVLNLPEAPEAAKVEISDARPELRPVPTGAYDLKGLSIQTPAGKASIKLGLYPEDNTPFEVWIDVSRAGTVLNADSHAVARLASLVLRLDSPVPPERRVELIIDQLEGLGGGDAVGFGPARVQSIPDGVAKGLRKLLQAWGAFMGEHYARNAAEAAQEQAVKEASEVLTLTSPPTGQVTGQVVVWEAGKGKVDICPSCHHATLARSEGCLKCSGCGYSKC